MAFGLPGYYWKNTSKRKKNSWQFCSWCPPWVGEWVSSRDPKSKAKLSDPQRSAMKLGHGGWITWYIQQTTMLLMIWNIFPFIFNKNTSWNSNPEVIYTPNTGVDQPEKRLMNGEGCAFGVFQVLGGSSHLVGGQGDRFSPVRMGGCSSYTWPFYGLWTGGPHLNYLLFAGLCETWLLFV